MKIDLEAQPWTAGFCAAAAPDNFPFCWVPMSRFFFLIGSGVFGVFWAELWGVPACLVLPTFPGLCPALSRHKTIRFSCLFFFLPADPPRRGGGRSRSFCHAYCGNGLCDFSPFRGYNFASPHVAAVVAIFSVLDFPLTRFRSPPPVPPLPGDMAVVFVDVFFPFRKSPVSFPFCLTFLFGFVDLPFRDAGVGFEEPHLRHML